MSSFVLYYLPNEKPGFCNNYDCYSGNCLEIKGHLEKQKKNPGNKINKESFECSVLLGKLSIPFASSAGPDSSPTECSQELQSESTDSGTEFI